MEGSGRKRPTVLLVAVTAALVGSMVGPQLAQAVGSVVTIQSGNSSSRASVNKANQVLGAETSPSAVREFSAVLPTGTCKNVLTVPAGKAFVLKEAVSVVTVTGGANNVIVLRLGADCPGLGTEILRLGGQAGTTTTVPLTPGFALAAGTTVSAESGNIAVDLYLFGYLVPASAVPATTPVVRA